jgi:hypothetical protein
MNHIFYNRIFLLVAFVFSFFSCSSDLDFEQANDFNTQPVFTTNLAYLQGKASDFVENGTELPPLVYKAEVGFFDSSFVNDNLVKAELYFRIKNTINKAFTFEIDLKEDSGVLVKKITIEVPASVNESEVLVDPTIVFDESQADDLRRTTQMVFTVTMLPGTPPLTETSKGIVELSSSITAYFDVR